MRRLAHWLLVLALSSSIGLPWAFLQSAAWVGMIVTFSREAPLAQSISMTFDGNHPCPLCKAVQRGESSQKKSDSLTSSVKFELAPPDCQKFVFPAVAQTRVPHVREVYEGVFTTPPSPPPEAA